MRSAGKKVTTYIKLCQCAFDRRLDRPEITQVFSQLALKEEWIEHGWQRRKWLAHVEILDLGIKLNCARQGTFCLAMDVARIIAVRGWVSTAK